MIGQKGIPARGGGIETHVDELVRALAERGVEITVTTRAWYTRGACVGVDGVRTVPLPSVHTKHLDAITHTLLSILRCAVDPPDVVHFHGVGPSLLAWLPRLLAPRSAVVFTLHSLDHKHSKWGPLARSALRLGASVGARCSDATIGVSAALARRAGREAASAVYIPNGAPKARAGDPAALGRWGLVRGRYVLFVGRFVRQKRVEDLLDAWRLLGKDRGVWQLVCVGTADEPSYEKALRERAECEPSVVWTGLQSGSDLWALLHGAGLFVSPTITEGASIAILEAMAYGVPLVLSDIEENRALVGPPAIWVPPTDPAALAASLRAAIADPCALTPLADRCRERIERDHGWPGIAGRTLEVYLQACERRASRVRGRRRPPAAHRSDGRD